jgi:hypothetical protein
MRSLILSAALGLGSLGVLAVTPDDAQARPVRVVSPYYAPAYYGGYPSYYAPAPVYYGGYYAPTTRYYAPAVGVVPSPSRASYYYSPGTAYYVAPGYSSYYVEPGYRSYYGRGYYWR